MKVIYGLHGFKKITKGSVLAIGVFDGVHIGHRKIIKNAVNEAKKRKLISIVITFDPHPTKILHPSFRAHSLISLAHRIRLIEELGADILVVLDFSPALANISADDFARKILVGKFNAKEVCVGDNFYFGRGARADADRLRRLGRSHGFNVNVLKSVKVGNNVVSSSLVRKMISSGELNKAAVMLGRRVSVLGTVVGGVRIARQLGYPTANLNPHHEVIPPSGVYAVLVTFQGRSYKGVLNIGLRPTFYAPRDREPAIEVHIFGFKKDIYGHDLEVFFIKKIRDEVRFSSSDSLVKQIKNDEKIAKIVLK